MGKMIVEPTDNKFIHELVPESNQQVIIKEVIVNVPQVEYKEIIVEKLIPQEVIIEKLIEVPVEKIIEVEKEVINYVDRIIHVDVPVEVVKKEKVVEYIDRIKPVKYIPFIFKALIGIQALIISILIFKK